MKRKNFLPILLLLILVTGVFHPVSSVHAARPQTVRADSDVTAYDLIVAMNTLRVSYGHAALVEDPIIDAVAQSTAEIMAANEMSWHIGDVRGRLMAAGYGGGTTVYATENFAAGTNYSIDQIMVVWSDESHMLPAVNGSYCNVGAGMAKSPNGETYYVLQAAYASGKSCGSYTSSSGSLTNPSGSTTGGVYAGVSQIIKPVKIATPDADGKIYHVVESGQSFWSIAIAYQITIDDIETWNNIKRASGLQIGQKLFIPNKNTVGYSTPTPVGMFQTNTPDADGKVVHTVAMYQTLSTIASAYGISVDKLLALNGIQADWTLSIGQKLLIDPGNVTPTPTPRPLSPIEKLTPASDGKYYHVVQSGEFLAYIADLYGVQVSDLKAWNNLTDASVLQPGQKLLLQVTPPATITPTPAPATATPTITPTGTSTPTSLPATEISATDEPGAGVGSSSLLWVGGIVVCVVIGGLAIYWLMKKRT
ncbi:MAG: LysM peptidoglycan-binding domain-containing protein [Anaerolineaceae bacterium]